MPVAKRQSSLASNIATVPQRHDNDNPLWRGPCAPGPLGGVTQSMLVRFMSCRERFRLKYVLGLEPPDTWTKTLGYGNMWHVCEEALAKGYTLEPVADEGYIFDDLYLHVEKMFAKYPLQREEIEKWCRVCKVQFPEYVKFWSEHPDVKNRTPLAQERVFDVPYTLPSGRVVRLRGKNDSEDLIKDEITGPDGGLYLQENKSKGDIDKEQTERQLKFDLQTMMYLTSLSVEQFDEKWFDYPIKGVRYNVVRRPLSGGKGSIKPHEGKCTKPVYSKAKGKEHVILHESKIIPAETADEFYERLRRDYLAAEPDYWFFRIRSEVSANDIKVFRETCLDPLLEQLCWWYDEITDKDLTSTIHDYGYPPLNYRTPFGVWSALEEGGSTEYDHYMETGSEAGLRRVHTLFPELQQ